MIYIGTCGFAEAMAKYFKNFKVVEVQQTFYKILRGERLKKWRSQAPSDFLFSLKVFQGVTHTSKSPTWKRSGFSREEMERLVGKVGYLRPTEEVFKFWKLVLNEASALDARFLLLQLPASFRDEKTNWENARKFFERIERKSEIAVELRGWQPKRIERFCKEFELIDCCDLLLRKPTYLTKSRIAYFRLHGSYESGRINYKHKYSGKELEILRERVENLRAKEVYVLFNNAYMLQDAKRFMKVFAKKD